ncbi:MAG TPA: alpha/beta fold hydrolase [Nocardioidaceae bacterium]|nr:alpha/beta fold hydrolase [Nocardioidaceae bacterium]
METLGRLLIGGSVAARSGISLGAELVRIGLGRSELTAPRADHRFRDPAWTENLYYRRLLQVYLAWSRAVETLVESAEADDWARAAKARFLLGILTTAAAPTNFLAGNPAALKRAFETGGTSLVRGARNWATDVATNGGMPSMVKKGSLKVGEHLALSPGGVVSRDEVAELIQYAPTTEQVHERPVLVVPPPIGRYYFLDLAPGRSFVEYATGRGLQTFMLSWRNPSSEQSDWDLDTYAARIATAIEEVRDVTGSDDVNIMSFCAGGIMTAGVLSRLAATGESPVHSVAFAVTLLDFGMSAPIGAFSSAKLLALARWNSRREGVITARNMGSVFSWMRPNDLVWNYWVNNYLMGNDPPEFDILSWNADGTNVPATLHGQFLDIFEHNPLVHPQGMTCLGSPIDLASITVPAFVAGAINDHLTPWRGTYRTVQLLGGETEFVLSNAGHIASLVNPPGNPNATYFTGPTDGRQPPEEWLSGAEKRSGSWWEPWAEWNVVRSGRLVPAPRTLGGAAHSVLGPAPGAYVRDEVPA